ncbi:hypothetical protein [Streptomyces sp. NPDC058486]|uniref:hypothetical protein n=1 Tax=unclassified Streptomyces TaxID=2593676 RepID=UPI0036588640
MELVRGGDRAALIVEVRDVDFTRHTVIWRATAPEGVRLEPSSGTVTVVGAQGASHQVTVTATAAATAGGHRIVLDFRLTDGTALTSAYVHVTVG